MKYTYAGCCIYEKPKNFGESSSEDSDDECEHCHGSKDAHKKPTPSNKDEPPGDAIPSHPGNNLISCFFFNLKNFKLNQVKN